MDDKEIRLKCYELVCTYGTVGTLRAVLDAELLAQYIITGDVQAITRCGELMKKEALMEEYIEKLKQGDGNGDEPSDCSNGDADGLKDDKSFFGLLLGKFGFKKG